MFDIPKLLIVGGIVLTLIGVMISYGQYIPYIGKLPGDLYYKRENVTFYVPITTSIIVSIMLSILWKLLGE